MFRWRSCKGKAPLYTSFSTRWLTGGYAILYPYTTCAHRLCGDARFARSVWQRYNAMATDVDTGSISGAPLYLPYIRLQADGHLTSHESPWSASAHGCTVWVYLRAILNRTFMATTALTASQRDGGDGVERNWDGTKAVVESSAQSRRVELQVTRHFSPRFGCVSQRLFCTYSTQRTVILQRACS